MDAAVRPRSLRWSATDAELACWSCHQMLRDTLPTAWPFSLLIETGAFVMQRKMLLEIRDRAEHHDG